MKKPKSSSGGSHPKENEWLYASAKQARPALPTKVRWSDLSIPVRIAIVAGWIYVALFVTGVILGFLGVA